MYHFTRSGLSIYESRKTKGIQHTLVTMANIEKPEKAIEKEQSIIRSLVEESDDVFIAVDKHYQVLALNEAQKKIFRRAFQIELQIGHNLLQTFENYPILYERTKAYYERVFQGEKYTVDTYEVQAEQKRYYELQFTPIKDKTGQVIGAAQTSRDITHKVEINKKIQEITKRSIHLTGEKFFIDLSEQLTSIFNAKYVYMGVFSEDHSSVNTLAFRIKGKLADNFSYSLNHTPCAAVSQNKETYYFENVQGKFPEDGKLERWNAESYVGIPVNAPSSGDPMGILVMINDKPWEPVPYADYIFALFATRAGAELERMRAEEKIRKKDKQLARVSDNVPGVIYEFRMKPDQSTEFLYVSDAAESLLELSPKELIKDVNKVYKQVHPEDRAAFFKAMERSASSVEHFHYEGRIFGRKSGKLKWIKIDAKPEKNEQGDIVWYGFIDDITKLKETEFELIKAKEESERAARAKEDFLATMSHEIRTPLNAILGLANLLLTKEPKEDQLENLHTLKFSSESLMNLINDILDLSKLESGKVEIKVARIDLRSLLHSIKQAHQLLATERNNSLIIEIDEKVPSAVLGDQVKLAQILNNLIGNAVKFTFDGVITVKVNVKCKKEENLFLHFSIKDTGIGIPQEKLQHIFEKFTQADNSTARQFGGTGLGLTITKMLLELLNSEIHVESTVNEGAVFYFDLHLKEDLSVSESRPGEHTNTTNLQRMEDIKILLVEDVAINRYIVIQYLQGWWDVQIDEASNGTEAIEMVKTKAYDIILMDIRMPEMDGFEAAKIIRSSTDPKLQQIPIIALTADTARDLKDSLYEFTDVVTKPFNPNELYAKVIKYTSASQPNIEAKNHPVQSDTPLLSGVIDYQMAEKPLRGDVNRVIHFYEVAEQTLANYKAEYTMAAKQRNVSEMGHVKHKAKLTLSMLGLKTLFSLLEKGKALAERESDQAALEDLLTEINRRFEEAIDAVKRRRSQVVQQGL